MKNAAAIIAATAPSRYSTNITTPRALNGPTFSSAPSSMLTSRMYTGSRAEQVISGAPIIVASRSLADGSDRVAMIPGIAHATEDSSATKARPSSPARAITRSIRNAARAR